MSDFADSNSTEETHDENAAVSTATVTEKRPLVVDVRNLWVRYGRTTAVKGIDLQIPRGEVYGFIGPIDRKSVV